MNHVKIGTPEFVYNVKILKIDKQLPVVYVKKILKIIMITEIKKCVDLFLTDINLLPPIGFGKLNLPISEKILKMKIMDIFIIILVLLIMEICY